MIQKIIDKKSAIYIIIIAVLVVLLIDACIYIKFRTKEEVIEPDVLLSDDQIDYIEDLIDTLSNIDKIPLSEYKVYYNNEYGFTFKYPPVYRELNSSVLPDDTEFLVTLISYDEFAEPINVFVYGQDQKFLEEIRHESGVVSEEDLEISGYEAKKFVIRYNNDQETAFVIIENNNREYVLIAENTAYFDKVISSFYFAD